VSPLVALLPVAATGATGAPPSGQAPLVAIEVAYSTRAGEGSSGVKRLSHAGCYEVESLGSAGAGARVRDSHAGCHLPGEVAEVFRQMEALAADGVVVRTTAPAVREEERLLGGQRTTITLVRADGSRWIAPGKETALKLEGALEQLPSDDQWYATPPAPPAGKGGKVPVLVVLSASDAGGASGPRRLQAALAADGRWWCHRSVPALPNDELKLSVRKTWPMAPADARARLGRILEGASPGRAADEQAPPRAAGHREISVEAAFAGGGRAPLHPAGLSGAVVDRFVGEMRQKAPACGWP
jgi:hypothetical protein